MADLTDLQAAETVKIAGSDSSGVENNFVNASAGGSLQIAGEGAAGTPAGGVVSVQGVSGGTPQPVKITDGTNTGLITTNGEQKVVDGVRNGGVYGALNIPTANTPVEAKVGASRLSNRKALIITLGSNGVFWGLNSSVTTTTGQPTTNGQVLTFSIDPDSTFQVWLVGSANNKNVVITEIP